MERDILYKEINNSRSGTEREVKPWLLNNTNSLAQTNTTDRDSELNYFAGFKKLFAQPAAAKVILPLRDRYLNSNGEEYTDNQLAASLNGLTIANNQNVWVFDINQQIKKPIQLLNPDGTAIKFPDFLGMAQLICGESAGLSEGFLYTAHTIRNLQELREHGKRTLGLKLITQAKFKPDLHNVLLSNLRGFGEVKKKGDKEKTRVCPTELIKIECYALFSKWSGRSSIVKQAAFAATIAALNRIKSLEGDGGLLDGNWHPDDPTHGAIQWKGSKKALKPGNTFSSRQAFEDFYKKVVQFGVKKWDTDGRFFYYSNGVGAVFQKATQAWINKYAKEVGGGLVFRESIHRSRGAF